MLRLVIEIYRASRRSASPNRVGEIPWRQRYQDRD
jgi:hypothetical protein